MSRLRRKIRTFTLCCPLVLLLASSIPVAAAEGEVLDPGGSAGELI